MSNRRIPPRSTVRSQSARLRNRRAAADGPLEKALVVLLCLGAVVGIVALIGLAVILSGLLTLLAWNVGVVGIASALGATVGKISLGIAICANFAIGIISRIFHGPTQVTKTS